MTDVASDVEPFEFIAPLTVCVDVKHPLAYLALGGVRELAGELDIEVDWLPFPAAAMKAPPSGGSGRPVAKDQEVATGSSLPQVDRSTRHRQIRSRYVESDVQRYAAVQGLTIRNLYRSPDSTPASLGLLWLRKHAPEKCADFLQRVFAGYWAERLNVEDPEAVGRELKNLGEDPAVYAAFVAGPGPGELAALRERLVAAGVFTVPSLVVEGEVFVGRAHLPMVRWLLKARSGPRPI